MIDNRGVITQNLFLYCANNPVKNVDISGNFFGTVVGAVIGGIFGGIEAAKNGGNILAGIGIGATTGAIAGFSVDFAVATGGLGGLAIAAVGGILSSGANYLLTTIFVNKEEINVVDLATEAIVGGLFNVLSFGTSGGSLNKVGGNVIKNIFTNAKEELLKNTMRHVAGNLVKKTKSGVVKNITKNILGEFFSSVSETLASSYATEVINYVFDPML